MTDPACERTPLTASDWLSAWTTTPVIPVRSVLWISRAILLCFAIGMFIATWAIWPSLVIDCGREMYVPAAMAQGKRLYGDVWYPYGPLAPAINTAMFVVFGISLTTLYLTGLAVFTGSALVLHSIALRFMPPVAAVVCGVAFLAQGFHSFIFNEILPYSYAATFGALLGLLTLLFLLRHLQRSRGPNLILAGIFAGLAVVSKFELLLPCAVGIALVLILDQCATPSLGQLRDDALRLLPGCAVAGGTYGWLVHEYGLDFLIHANWMSAPGSYFMQRYGALWLRTNGLSFVPSEIAKMMAHALVAMSAWWVLALLLNKRRYLIAAGTALLIAIIGFYSGLHFALLDYPIFREITVRRLARALPDDMVFPKGMYLIVLAFLIFLAARAIHRRQMPAPGLVIAIAMGLMLALKVMMEIRPHDYAIYSSSILFVVFMTILWRLVERTHPNPQPRARSLAAATYFGLFLLLFVRVAAAFYSAPLPVIHTSVGDVRASPENIALMTRFLPVLQEAKSRGQRVLLLPELTALYFIAGMESPSRYEMINPGTLEPGKYTEMYLRELERNRPDLIILSNRRTDEYGVNYFGLDYDQEVMKWIENRYQVTGEIGHFERSAGAPVSALIYTPKK